MQRNWTLDRVMRYVLIAVAVAVSLYVLNYLRGVLFPFFAAFLIAYIMDPLVCWLQIKFRYRVIAVIVVILACAIIIGGCMYFFVPVLGNAPFESVYGFGLERTYCDVLACGYVGFGEVADFLERHCRGDGIA